MSRSTGVSSWRMRQVLRAEFDHLRVVEVRTELNIRRVEPLVRYLDSIRFAAEPALGGDGMSF